MGDKNQKKKVLLAFSGGLDTSAIVPWLKETMNADVICYCSDLGNAPNAKELAAWSKKLGASDFIFEDLKDTFAKDFAFRAVRAGATYQDDYLLGTSLGRPLIAERMAFYAKKLGAYGIAHGATGKGNDQLRFEKSWAYLAPDLKVIAPWKIWEYKGRKDLLAYLKTKGFELSTTEKKHSVDTNLFHRSCEGGILEKPEKEYDPAEIYEWVAPPSNVSTEAFNVQLDFARGYPVKLNGKAAAPAALLAELNRVAGLAGVGVVDLVEERANGIKSRGVYETPGGTVLHAGCKALKHLSWDRSLMTLARTIGSRYGELVYDGEWHTDARKAADAFFDAACETITGRVSLRLQAGQVRVLARQSKYALYDESSVSFESDEHGILKHAEGYSKTVSFKHWVAGRRDKSTSRDQ